LLIEYLFSKVALPGHRARYSSDRISMQRIIEVPEFLLFLFQTNALRQLSLEPIKCIQQDVASN